MTGYILMIKLKGFKDEQLDRKRNWYLWFT